jgi:hypothetical protein
VLSKPAGTLCEHSTGTACGIYQDRPAACAAWYCLWRKIGALPDELRPDRSGVMLTLETAPGADDPFLRARIVCRAVHRADDLKGWEAVEAIAMFAREGSLPVWTAFGRFASLAYPEADQADRLREAIDDPRAPTGQGAAEAMAWRQRLGYGSGCRDASRSDTVTHSAG